MYTRFKFYNREKELKSIKKVIKGKGTRVIIVKGLRRIGKTRLVLEACKGRKDFIRLFIPKDKTSGAFLEDITKKYGLPRFVRLIDLINYLFEKYKIVFLDEFQNFYSMEPSIFSEIQDLIDNYRYKGKELCLLISGSSYSLINKIFYDYSKALYGRRDLEINLKELEVNTILKILSDLGIKKMEDKVKFYSVFGGMPKFYELIFNFKIKSFKEFLELFLINNYNSLLEEGKSILISELGGEHKSYLTVMEAIASGKNKLHEIAGFFNNNLNRANRYLNMLANEYSLVNKIKPSIGKSKGGIYTNSANFFDFWFNYIRKYSDLVDELGIERVVEIIENNINSFFGRKFESFIRNLIKERSILSNFQFTKLGRQWGKIPGKPKGENEYEIDLVALNEKSKEILFGECKWREKVNAKKICKELVEKSQWVQWYPEKRKENFAIFAKSFSKKITNFEGKKIYCFDLKDLEKFQK